MIIIAVDILSLLTPTVTFYSIYLILATSYNLEHGFAGQPNFGRVLFYSIGAYVAGNFTANVLMNLAGVGGVDFLSDFKPSLLASKSTIGADINAPPGTDRKPRRRAVVFKVIQG